MTAGASRQHMQKKIAFLDPDVVTFFRLLFGAVEDARFSIVAPGEADYLFYSPFTPDHHAARPDVVKILIVGENLCPDFNACDYAISGEYLDYGDRHLRMPHYAAYTAAEALASRPVLTTEDLARKTGFCNFVYSNSALADPRRDRFFHALNGVVPVVSAGQHLRNDNSLQRRDPTADWGAEKRALMERFRFTIAMENSEQAGYVTEKISDAFMARTVPIYWGDPRVVEEFNPAAFLHLRDYSDHAEAVADIRKLDAAPDRLLAMLNAPVFSGGIDRVAAYLAAARDFLENIFDRPLAEARRRPRYGRVLWLEQKRRKDQTGLRRRLRGNRF